MIRMVCAVVVLACLTPTASAFPQFQKEWNKLYLTDHPDEKFVKHVKKEAKCWVCHQGKKKSLHNPYGVHFVGKIGKKDKKDVEKMVAEFKRVAELHSDQKDEKSPTYQELITKSKLPGGPLKEAKQQPKKQPKEKEKDKEKEAD